MTRLTLAAAVAVLAGCGVGPSPGTELATGWSAQAETVAPGADPGTASAAKETQALTGTTVEAYAPILKGCDLSTALRGAPLPAGCSNNGPLRSSSLAWVRLDGVTMEDGSPVSAVALDGTRLTGLVNGAPVSGADFEKARFLGVATTGAAVPLKAEHVERGHDHQEDVWRYELRYLTPKGDWKNLCEGGKEAVIVSGRWDAHQGVAGDGAKIADPTVFTIGCRRSAIEKCVNGGYLPWAERGGISLDPYHQACVRMLRADYCGDAISHTAPGRQVNLYDGLGIQRDDERWVSEAEWTAAGASCLSTRNLTAADAPCLGALGTPACGETPSFTGTTLIISETPHAGGRDGHL